MKSFVFLLLLGTATNFSAASSPWSGTWKLNESKSHRSRVSFSVGRSPAGEYFVDIGTAKYHYFCDGKDYPTYGHYTTSCKEIGLYGMDMVSKDNGRVVSTSHRQLSPDGETQTITAKVIHADGTTESKVSSCVRLSKSIGFAGLWANVPDGESPSATMVIEVNGSMMRVGFPKSKQYTDVKLDGSDAVTKGLASSNTATLAIKPSGSNQMSIVLKLNGKPIKQGTMSLSSDGRTLSEEVWRPETPMVKTLDVFEKQ